MTVEKLGELLKEPPRGLLMVCDELSGFLADMERKEYQSDCGFYLKAFNGYGGFTYDRIGRGTIYIPNATVSIIGGIQPSRIIPFIKEILYGKNDDGLLQRFQMLVWPNEIEEPDWIDRYPNQDAQQDYERLFRSLYDKPLGSPEHPITMRFSADAQEIFCEWWKSFQKKVKKSHFSDPLQAHLLKMPKTIASLALIFKLTEGGRFEIGLYAITTALRWKKYLLSHVKTPLWGGR